MEHLNQQYQPNLQIALDDDPLRIEELATHPREQSIPRAHLQMSVEPFARTSVDIQQHTFRSHSN